MISLKDKITLVTAEEKVPISVSVLTWHDDCYSCFLYCSFMQRLVRASIWSGSINSESTMVYEEVKNTFPAKPHFQLHLL